MIRRAFFLWAGVIVFAGAILNHTSTAVEEQSRQLQKLNAQIIAEQEAIHVLEAEWAYLNAPARIERLARTHLAMQVTAPSQIVAMAQLPAALARLQAPAAAASMDTMTGGVADNPATSDSEWTTPPSETEASGAILASAAPAHPSPSAPVVEALLERFRKTP